MMTQQMKIFIVHEAIGEFFAPSHKCIFPTSNGICYISLTDVFPNPTRTSTAPVSPLLALRRAPLTAACSSSVFTRSARGTEVSG